MFENFLQFVGTFVLETKDFLQGGEDRNLTTKDLAMYAIACVIIFLMLALWILVFFAFCKQFHKLNSNKKVLFTLWQGLSNSWMKSFFYYIVYFLVRICISLAIFFATDENALTIYIALIIVFFLMILFDTAPFENLIENIVHVIANNIYFFVLFIMIYSKAKPLFKDYEEGERETISKRVMLIYTAVIISISLF